MAKKNSKIKAEEKNSSYPSTEDVFSDVDASDKDVLNEKNAGNIVDIESESTNKHKEVIQESEQSEVRNSDLESAIPELENDFDSLDDYSLYDQSADIKLEGYRLKWVNHDALHGENIRRHIYQDFVYATFEDFNAESDKVKAMVKTYMDYSMKMHSTEKSGDIFNGDRVLMKQPLRKFEKWELVRKRKSITSLDIENKFKEVRPEHRTISHKYSVE